jgi:hypothetical protein
MSEQGGNGVAEATAGPNSSSDPLLGQVLDGRYRIESILGEGGMGLVYKAVHTALNKPLAIKVLRPEVSKNEQIVARFRQEAQSASAIGNQHIIDISDFGVLGDGSTYFVMEFLTGQSLTGAMESERFPTERTIGIAKQLANALGAAHEIGVVHRDMKPDNVQLIRRGGNPDFVKVLDFGIAKVGGSTSKLTQAGQVFGTPHYMSPEQCAGTTVDHRTDIYAVGVILYEMATGQVPFDADNLMGILTKHLYENPIPPHELPPPTDVPSSLEAVILKCLAKKPEARYQSMAELNRDLEAVAQGLTPQAVAEQVGRSTASQTAPDLTSPGRVTVGMGQPEVPMRKLSPVVIGIGVLLVAGIGAALAFSGGSGGSQEQADAHVVQPAAPEAAATPTPPPAEEPPAEAAKVSIQSDPEGAEIYEGSALLGNTPYALPKPTGSDSLELELRKSGYEPKKFTISAISGEELKVSLAKKAAPPPPPPSKPTARPKRKKPTTTKPTPKPTRRNNSEVLDPWD